MDLPTIEKYAKLWTLDRKQIYVFDEEDVNLKHPYQVFINTFDNKAYIWKNGRVEETADFYVYEWVNYREWTEDDGYALQISNQKAIPLPEEDEGDEWDEWDGD